MATSKIMYISESKTSKHAPLIRSINYILDIKNNGQKTEGGLYQGGINCMPETAAKDMIYTKKLWGKENKRQGYHLILSFPPEEKDKETAFKIIKEFAEEYLGKRFEALYAMHTNTDILHGHIIFNSVSFSDGYKYRYESGDWDKYIQPLLDDICDRNGFERLSACTCLLDAGVVTDEEHEREHTLVRRKNVSNKTCGSKNKYRNENSGNFINWGRIIASDIDRYITHAKSFPELLDIMREHGYEIKEGKDIAIRPPGMAHFRSLDSGYMKGYTKEAIIEKINKYHRKTNESKTNSYNRYNINIDKSRLIISVFGQTKIKVVKTPFKSLNMQEKKRRELVKMGIIKNMPFSYAYKHRMTLYNYQKIWQENAAMIKYNIVSSEAAEKALGIIDKKITLLSGKNRKKQDLMQLYQDRKAVQRIIKQEGQHSGKDKTEKAAQTPYLFKKAPIL